MASIGEHRGPWAWVAVGALLLVAATPMGWHVLQVAGVLTLAAGVIWLWVTANREPPPTEPEEAEGVEDSPPRAAPSVVIHQEITELRPLLDGLLGEAAAGAEGLELELELADFVPSQVMVDRARLSQMLGGLLARAVRVTAAGSVVLAVEPDGEHLRFVVQDRGAGIPKTRQAELFAPDGPEPEVARVRQLAEAMGGKAGVRSVLGEGSRFWFTVSMNLPETKVPDAPPVDLLDR